MKFKIVGDSLIYIDEGYTIVNGENEFDIIEIEAPRYRNELDCMSMSFRLTATSAENTSISAVQVLAKQELDDTKILLSGSVTTDFSSIEGKALFMVTGVTANGITAIFKSSRPIAIENNTSLESLPDKSVAEQLFIQAQLEAQKAVDANGEIRDMKQEITELAEETFAAVETANNAVTTAEALLEQNTNLPATDTKLGVVKVDGKTIIVDDEGTISTIDFLNEMKGYLGYTDPDILGLQADFENSVFTRLSGAVGKSAGTDFDSFSMYGGRRRCNVLDDGTITAYYGDENYVEDGSNGQVMVYQPKFYYKVVPIKLEPITDGIGYHLRKANYYISSTPKSGFKLHPAFYGMTGSHVDYILLSAYEGSIYDVSANAYLANDEQVAVFTSDKLSSIAGVKPCSGRTQNLTRQNAEVLAQNRGTGWHIDTIKTVSANQLLMAIEYASFNSQDAIGQGVVSYHTISTGETSNIGNISGSFYGIQGETSISYRGMENIWGNIWKLESGINIYGNGSQKGGIPYICNNFNFTENTVTNNYESVEFTITNSNGFISAFGYSEKYDWLFIPSEAVGNSNLPIGDYIQIIHDNDDFITPVYGGDYSQNARAGFFSWGLVDIFNIAASYIGCRNLYIPQSKT